MNQFIWKKKGVKYNIFIVRLRHDSKKGIIIFKFNSFLDDESETAFFLVDGQFIVSRLTENNSLLY